MQNYSCSSILYGNNYLFFNTLYELPNTLPLLSYSSYPKPTSAVPFGYPYPNLPLLSHSPFPLPQAYLCNHCWAVYRCFLMGSSVKDISLCASVCVEILATHLSVTRTDRKLTSFAWCHLFSCHIKSSPPPSLLTAAVSPIYPSSRLHVDLLH